MKRLSLTALISFFGIVFSSKAVFGYIDPGTGSIIASSLWPLIVAFFSTVVAFLIKYFWKPIKKIYSKLLRLEKNEKR
ncbi:MAG: hypothetical protein ISS47_06260 [Candidatus Omnitrophica bacterium]|nr:hypothetical protein [Candidatus Omnitrophota bacterium]